MNEFWAFQAHTIISFVGNNLLAHMTLSSKRSRMAIIMVWAGAWVFSTLSYYACQRLGVSNPLPYYLITSSTYLIVYAYLFKERFSQKFFVFFMFWSFSSFLGSLCIRAVRWAGRGHEHPWIRVSLYFACFVVLVLLYRRFWSKAIRYNLAIFVKGNPAYAAFPLVAFIVFAAIFGPASATTDAQGFLLMLLFEALALFMYYILFAHFRLIFEGLQAENRIAGAERQQRLQKKYYEEVEKDVQAQARLLHDARHHFLAVASLAREDSPEAVDRYVSQLLKTFGSAQARRYCRHSLANAVIGSYIDIAEKAGIAVSTDLDLPEDLVIDEYDLCSFFGNTIENAIEACQRIPPSSASYPKRFIDLRSSIDKGRLVIRIENSYPGKLGRERDGIQSSKGAAGGLGLQSVKLVVDSYAGGLDYSAGENTFVLSAVLFPRSAAREN